MVSVCPYPASRFFVLASKFTQKSPDELFSPPGETIGHKVGRRAFLLVAIVQISFYGFLVSTQPLALAFFIRMKNG
jgi:hypothetical protein